MRVFNKVIDIEEARRRGRTVPEADIGLEDCTSTSSERQKAVRTDHAQQETGTRLTSGRGEETL